MYFIILLPLIWLETDATLASNMKAFIGLNSVIA